MTSNQARDVLLVGSVPLTDSAAVFRTATDILGDRVLRIPDGEIGPLRTNWIRCQGPVFSRVAGLELLPPEDPNDPRRRERYKLKDGVAAGDIHFANLNYADWAMEAFAIFKLLKDEKAVREATRLQVSLPSPLAVTGSFLSPEVQPSLEPVYEAAMMREVERMSTTIPHDQLAVQFDCTDVLLLEGVRPVAFSDPKGEIVQRMIRWGNHVPTDVELGYHLCYGDAGHRHAVEPADTGNMVELANGFSAGISRSIQWIHMPVPRDRSDDAYFAPLQNLRLRPETKLFLGLVHKTGGIEGTRKRLKAAEKVVSEFGIATECGLGRRPSEDIPDLLRIHAQAAAT